MNDNYDSDDQHTVCDRDVSHIAIHALPGERLHCPTPASVTALAPSVRGRIQAEARQAATQETEATMDLPAFDK